MNACNIFIFILCICKCHSARILGVFHISSHSHQQLGVTLLNELAEKGHDVTLLTPVVPKRMSKNLTVVHVKYSPRGYENWSFFDLKNMNIFEQIVTIEQFGISFAEAVLESAEVQKFLLENHHFDLIIMEQFINEAFRGLCYHYRAPCISLSTLPSNRWTNRQMGNPLNPSYVPELFSPLTDQMSFFERLKNTFVLTFEALYIQFFVLPKQDEILHKHFPDAPSIYDLYYNTSLILLNAHVAVNPSVPIVPNMIPIGGFHIIPPDPLPADLQKYMDNAKEGVLYFSMGSNLNSENMGEHRITAFFNVFKKLKQKVLWKMQTDKPLNLPSNVKVSSWFPQQSILAHPNTKLFITHAGLLSTMESIHHAVPMVAIPIFGDQASNAVLAEQRGYAKVVSYTHLNEQELDDAVRSVLTNPKYLDAARMRSKIFRDDPIKPLEKAVYWVEYVMRYRGAPHLRTAALRLEWYQYLLLDVILYTIIVIFGSLFVFTKIAIHCFGNTKSMKKAKLN